MRSPEEVADSSSNYPRQSLAGRPHLISHWGNGGQKVFFNASDYQTYLMAMREECARHEVSVLGYCLMPAEVRLVVVPRTAEGLTRAVSEAHRRYTASVNKAQGWTGVLWKGRFSSFVVDDPYLPAVIREIELMPVSCGLATEAWAYPWSSAGPRCSNQPDFMIGRYVTPVGAEWKAYLSVQHLGMAATLEAHARSGVPLADSAN